VPKTLPLPEPLTLGSEVDLGCLAKRVHDLDVDVEVMREPSLEVGQVVDLVVRGERDDGGGSCRDPDGTSSRAGSEFRGDRWGNALLFLGVSVAAVRRV
jgi:hypothetical protein